MAQGRLRIGGVSTHSIARAVEAASIGTIKAYEDRKAQDALVAMGEHDIQIQVPYSGTIVGFIPIRTDEIFVEFNVTFIRAPQEFRDSPYEFPHFTYGDEQGGVAENTIFASCILRRWIFEEDEVTGAVVMILLHNPFAEDSTTELDYSGVMHLNFEGFAAPFDTTEDE